jgi:transposase
MGRAYSDDLRRKLLEAHDRGDGSLRELARRFGVSAPYAWKISSQRRRSGQMERPQQRHGPRSRISPAVQASLRGLLRQQPDLTLAELQEGLEKSAGVAVSVQHLWRVLQKMGLRLKKSRSTRKSKTRSKSKPAARAGGKQ